MPPPLPFFTSISRSGDEQFDVRILHTFRVSNLKNILDKILHVDLIYFFPLTSSTHGGEGELKEMSL